MAGAPNFHTEAEWNALLRRLDRVERAIQSIPYITDDDASELKKLIDRNKTHSDELPLPALHGGFLCANTKDLPPINWGDVHPENLPPINWDAAHPELLPTVTDNGPQMSDSIADRLSKVEHAVDNLKQDTECLWDVIKLCLKTVNLR